MKEVAYKGILFRLDVVEDLWFPHHTLVSAEARVIDSFVGKSSAKYSKLGYFTVKKDED